MIKSANDFFELLLQAHEQFQTSVKRENDLRKREIKSLKEKLANLSEVRYCFDYKHAISCLYVPYHKFLLEDNLIYAFIQKADFPKTNSELCDDEGKLVEPSCRKVKSCASLEDYRDTSENYINIPVPTHRRTLKKIGSTPNLSFDNDLEKIEKV